MPRVWELLRRYLGVTPELGAKILATLGVIVGYLLVRRIARRLFQRVGDVQSRYEHVWTSIVESGVRLTMRYLCKPRDRRSSASAIWEAMLDELRKMPEVHLAYPTTRFVGNAPTADERTSGIAARGDSNG